VDVSSNPYLESLNLINGNNVAIQYMNAGRNGSLYCIGVDDPAYSTINPNWLVIDPDYYTSTGDCDAPMVFTQDIEIFLDRYGEASISTSDVDNGSTDNETSNKDLIFSLSTYNFDCSNLGPNTVTLTVTDESGNESSESTEITVVDIIPPTAKAIRSYSYDLIGSGVTLEAPLLDDGSSDNCDVSLSLSQSYFTLAGTYYIDLIVDDGNGNIVTDQVEVEIIEGTGNKELKFGGTTVIVSPNPFSNDITLSFSKSTNFNSVSVMLTNLVTQMSVTTDFVIQDDQTLKATDLSLLTAGTYVISITVGNKTKTAILMKSD